MMIALPLLNVFFFLPSLRQTRKERWLSKRNAVFCMQAEVRVLCETWESISHRLRQATVFWTERHEWKQQSFAKSRGHEKTDTWQSSKERMEKAIKYFILETQLRCKYNVWDKMSGAELKIILEEVFSSQRLSLPGNTIKYVLLTSCED